MEEKEKRHVFRNLTDLVDNTQWNTSCVSVPIQTNVFSYDDTAQLESIPNLRMRVLEFYRIFMTKHNSYQHLIATLEKGRQSGAVEILRSLDPIKYPPQLEQQVSSCSTSETDKTGQMTQQHATGSIVDFSMEKLHITTNKNSYPQQFAMTDNADQVGSDMNSQTIQHPIKGVNKIPTSMSIRFNVHNPTRLFTGRMKELAELHGKMQNIKTMRAVVSQMASVAGLGEIGKTELARMYIQKYADEYNNNVIWISAETEETLIESFRRLATDYLNLSQKNVDGEEKHIKTLIDEVYRYFNGEKCLFVFDNAECNDTLQMFLPLQVANPPQVLITSRDRDWTFGVEMIELNEMDELDAISLVIHGLGIQDKNHHDDMIVQLVKTLQCFPLAISQAVSYIKEQQVLQNYSIAQYLEEYKSCSEKLLSSNVRPAAVCTYTETTLTTWKLTTKLISADKYCGKEAVRMLNIISYFQPETIPTKLLLCDSLSKLKMEADVGEKNTISTSEPNQVEKNKTALQLILKYSMVNIQPNESTVSVHRLVQEVTRIQLRRKQQEVTTLRDALHLLMDNLDLPATSHFCSVYKYCGAYKEIVVQFKDAPWRIFEVMEQNVVSTNYSGANIGNEFKETLQKHVSLEDVDVIKLERRIAWANHRLGKYEMALEIFERVLPIYLENITGLFTKEEILGVQLWFSHSLKRSGKRTESLKMMLQTYESAKVVHGLNHWWTIKVLLAIAQCLRELGHFKKQVDKTVEYLQDLTQDFSVPDPQEVVSLLKAAYENNKHLINADRNYSNLIRNIATFFYKLGDNNTLSTIANDVYEKGKNSSDSRIQANAMNSLGLLAILKDRERKYEEALDIYTEVFAFCSHTLGENHLETLTNKRNILSKLRVLGQGEIALEGLQDVLKTLETGYPNHPHVFRTEMEIGKTLLKLKRYEECLALFFDLRVRLQNRFGLTEPILSELNDWIERAQKVIEESRNEE